MKKLKVSLIIFVLFCSIFIFALGSNALDDFEVDANALGDQSIKTLIDATDEETATLLKSLGLDNINIESLLEISPHKVIELIFDLFRGKLVNIGKYGFFLIALLIVISLIDSFYDESSEMTLHFSSLYSVFLSLIIISPLLACITNVLSAINLTRNFTLILIPIFAGIVTVSGNPALALNFHSLSFFASQGISAFASQYLSAFIGVNLSLCVSGAINPLLKTGGIISAIKKIFTKTLGFCGSMFVGLLSVKGLLASSADSLAYKGGKFLLGGFVPIIGSVLSDGLSSIISSLSLLNAFIGGFGIIIIALIGLPVIIEVLVWWFVLNLTSLAATMLGKDEISSFLEGLSDILVMINVLLIFILFLFISSIGLTLSFKA